MAQENDKADQNPRKSGASVSIISILMLFVFAAGYCLISMAMLPRSAPEENYRIAHIGLINGRITLDSEVDIAELLSDRHLHTIVSLVGGKRNYSIADVYFDKRVTKYFTVFGYTVSSCNESRCQEAKANSEYPTYKTDSAISFQMDLVTGYQIIGADKDGSHFLVYLPARLFGDLSNPNERKMLYVSRSDMTRIIEEYMNVRAALLKHYLNEQAQHNEMGTQEFPAVNSDLRSVH